MMDETPSVQEPAGVEDDVLELTDRYEAPEAEHIGDLDIAPAEAEERQLKELSIRTEIAAKKVPK